MVKHKLKELRVMHGYTQKEVADKLGCTQSAYSRVERGEGELFLDMICAIKKIYNISADEIIVEEDKKDEKK